MEDLDDSDKETNPNGHNVDLIDVAPMELVEFSGGETNPNVDNFDLIGSTVDVIDVAPTELVEFSGEETNPNVENLDLIDVAPMERVTFKVGELFSSYEDLEAKLKSYSAENFTEFWKRDARTVATASKRVARPISNALKYYEITFCCIHGGKTFKARGNGIRSTR